MDKIYNVSIIGCGNMGYLHAEGIYSKPNVSIEYACDIDLNCAKELQAKFFAKNITTDYIQAVTDPNVDIVIIATYPSSHLEILKLCIEHKKHVLCEKPICANEADGEEFMRLVKDNPDVKVLIGYILRHNKSYQKIAEMIHDGAIGKPIIIRMAQNHHTMNWNKYLALIEETSPIIDCGIHYFDVARWFTGADFTDISARGLKTEADISKGRYNYGIASFKLSDGSVGFYEVGWTNTISSGNIKEFVGPLGSIRLVYAKDRLEHKEEGDLIEYFKLPEKEYKTINLRCERKPMGDQFQYLVDMIEKGIPATPSAEDVWKSFKAAFDADKLIRDGLDK